VRAVGRPSVVAVVAVMMLAGCGGSDPATTVTTSTVRTTTVTSTNGTTTATEPAITSFEVGDLSCSHGVAAPVTISWKTESAIAVKIAVDKSSPTGYGPEGSTEFYVACDGAAHTISITPLSDTGRGATQSEVVSPV
jgi:hypothetical protein